MIRTCVIIFISLLLLSFRPSYETTVYGHLISRSHKKNISRKYVFVRYYDQILASATTNADGRFRMSFNIGSGIDSPIRFYYLHNTDTVFLRAVYTFKKSEYRQGEDQAFNLSFYIP